MREGRSPAGARMRQVGKGTVDANLVMKRKVRLMVVLGITFCVIGGAVVASSLLLDWVLNAPGNLTLWDLVAKGGIYPIAAIIPLAGALVAVLSAAIALVAKGRRRFYGPVSMGSLAGALLIVLSLVLVAMAIDSDYVGPGESSYGPAMFMSVFGGVLAVAGGIILTTDYLEVRARRGRFTVSGGSPMLKGALRPAPKAKTKPPRERADGDLGERLTADGSRMVFDEGAGERLACPSCNSTVQPSWRICPICGEELQ